MLRSGRYKTNAFLPEASIAAICAAFSLNEPQNPPNLGQNPLPPPVSMVPPLRPERHFRRKPEAPATRRLGGRKRRQHAAAAAGSDAIARRRRRPETVAAVAAESPGSRDVVDVAEAPGLRGGADGRQTGGDAGGDRRRAGQEAGGEGLRQGLRGARTVPGAEEGRGAVPGMAARRLRGQRQAVPGLLRLPARVVRRLPLNPKTPPIHPKAHPPPTTTPPHGFLTPNPDPAP